MAGLSLVQNLCTRWKWSRITEPFAVDYKVPAVSLWSSTLWTVTACCAFSDFSFVKKWHTVHVQEILLQTGQNCYMKSWDVTGTNPQSSQWKNLLSPCQRPDQLFLTWSACALFGLTNVLLCITDLFHTAHCELIFLHIRFKMSAGRCKVKVTWKNVSLEIDFCTMTLLLLTLLSLCRNSGLIIAWLLFHIPSTPQI